jgi:hypothetical protein
MAPVYESYTTYKAMRHISIEEKRIVNCLGYLMKLIFNSEKDGTYGL